MGIESANIISDGPYKQSSTNRKEGCQIDYLVQTYTKNLFICEFKFKRREIGIDIIDDIKKKIKSLKVPKGIAILPVLFHIRGVSSSLATAEYFYRIIDIADFLEEDY